MKPGELEALLTTFAGEFDWSSECLEAVCARLAEHLDFSQRYADLGPVGAGGMGVVRRAYDGVLQRSVAVKRLRPELSAHAGVRRRFWTEATITAGLDHPGIVPVYDRGQTPDGELWYTMKLVHGRTLSEVAAALHAVSDTAGWGRTSDGWTLRRLVATLRRVCEAVAYAHDRGVVHRDLKPENVMVGRFGEAYVMDWGLARSEGGVAPGGEDSVPPSGGETRLGGALGTPGYMAPEQARGMLDDVGAHSDVYALGATLFHLLTGHRPVEGRLEPLASDGPPIPAPLASVVARATRAVFADRFGDASELVVELTDWLDGDAQRREALERFAQAEAMCPELRELRASASRLRQEARALRRALPSHTSAESKGACWAAEDEATALERRVRLREAAYVHTLHAALSLDDELPEARAALAEHHRSRLDAADRARDTSEAEVQAMLVMAYDDGRHARHLEGWGALTLHTEPAGASVTLSRFELRGRRLVPKLLGSLGEAPFIDFPLKMGDYSLRIEAQGFGALSYPLRIERGGGWDAGTLRLPTATALGAGEVLVPAGWSAVGGDPDAADGLPRETVFLPAFVVRVHPVTNAEYIGFLDSLSDAEAEPRVPGRRGRMGGQDGAIEYERHEDGFRLVPRREGLERPMDWPVVQVDWWSAVAFSDWMCARTGQPWRLLHEYEREKAARGVDERALPWGDEPEATWTNCGGSRFHGADRRPVDTLVDDVSPYGVRGLAGNVRDWCLNVAAPDGPSLRGGRVSLERPGDDDFRAVRGGAWGAPISGSRAAARYGARPDERFVSLGFRLARSPS